MSDWTPVTLRCESAKNKTRVARARGREIRFELVTGITLPGSRMAAFRHREYDDVVIKGRAPVNRTYQFSQEMAQRLLVFGRCLTRGVEGYSGHTFLQYLFGEVGSPIDDKPIGFYSKFTKAADVRLGGAYTIAVERKAVHPFVGLGPGVALHVGGPNGVLAVSLLDQLIAGFGGTGIGEFVIPR